MATRTDAVKEHAPFERPATPSGRHPRPRAGATARKRKKEMSRPAPAATPAPAKGGKKK